jgi:excinuclease ABC subunit A
VNIGQIVLKGVSVHNLQNIDLTLDCNQLIVFTGVSGSGKSSLAFDTIYLEGQRRYIESLSHSLKRHLQEMKKPQAQKIEGISPTIAIEQKSIHVSPRSTVGTMTHIYDYLRVLYAKIGIPHCPISNEKVQPQSKEQITTRILEIEAKTPLIFLVPLAKNKKGSFKDEIKALKAQGYTRIRLDGSLLDLSDIETLDPQKAHDLDLVVDRFTLNLNDKNRIFEAVNTSLNLGKGFFSILLPEEEITFSEFAFSQKSGLSYPPLTISDFSFNHPEGMCPQCQGLGIAREFDLHKILDPEKSLIENCISIAPSYHTVRYKNIYDNLASIYDFSVKTPWKKLSKEAQKVLLYGTEKKWTRMTFYHPKTHASWSQFVEWKGILGEAHERLNKAKSNIYQNNMYALMTEMECPSCHNARIKPYPAATLLHNKKIFEITAMTLEEALNFFQHLSLNKNEKIIASDLIQEITSRLQYLINVGLAYLTLDRTSPTLSGGEIQRVRLASHLGCPLIKTTYILDEPSIGLHPQDHSKLIQALIDLKNRPNTVIIVEHDLDTIRHADMIVDIGPYAGKEGGKIVAQGSLEDIKNSPDSLTGQYLSGKRKMPIFPKRELTEEKLQIFGSKHNNLKNVTLSLPLHTFIAVTGVSGSGKSSLISDTLYPALFNALNDSNLKSGHFKKMVGQELIDKVIFIDQSAIGRTPRSNPATFTKLFDDIRSLYALVPQAKALGLTEGHFSFNTSKGFCPYCRGMGSIAIDMDFLEEEKTECPQCHGKKYSEEILSVFYKGKTIFDVLDMPIKEAVLFFSNIPKIFKKLQLLEEVGLGYMSLGQSSTTLSGGEAQRIKLAKELSRPSTGKTLYILDEPTTGLHFYDMEKLLQILHKLVDKGNTVVVIEHNMEFVKTADWIIELGPKAGKEGGEIIFEGPLKKLMKDSTPTAQVLQKGISLNKQKTDQVQENKNSEYIIVEKANQNNLKNISCKIPHNQFVVFTGPSGSGKTSLAIDTLYAEGEKEYLETLPSYIRQQLKQLAKPKVEKISNLLPTIALEQKKSFINPRSTVGTISETYDFLRILYPHLAIFYSPETNEKILSITFEYVIDKLIQEHSNEKAQILSPISLKAKETFLDFKNRLQSQGYLKIRLNNKYYDLDEEISYNASIKNEILLVIDRLKINSKESLRLFEAIQSASKISNQQFYVALENEDLFFNLAFATETTGKSYSLPTFQTFSFNAPLGMCLDCEGLGTLYGMNLQSYQEIQELTLFELLSILFYADMKPIVSFFKSLKIPLHTPIYELKSEDQKIIFEGNLNKENEFSKNHFLAFKGLNATLAYAAKHSTHMYREALKPFVSEHTCSSCAGERLNPLARHARLNGLTIHELTNLTIDDAILFLEKLSLKGKNFLKEPLEALLKELHFIQEIGLGYLSLNRKAPTLSGGEMQRLSIAKHLGSFLSSCLYILDEPSTGLHPKDIDVLYRALKKLLSKENSLIVIEHDPQLIEKADYLIDFGPEAGEKGGQILAQGTLKQILKSPSSLTGAYLSGKKTLVLPEKRRVSQKMITVKNADLHNLKNITVEFPKGAITCITGVSGSGKSSLVEVIEDRFKNYFQTGEILENLSGMEGIHQFLKVDQSVLSMTSRSDVATYSDLFTLMRKFYSELKQAKTLGLYPRHFSYNHFQGMCKTCWGLGYKNIDLQFLPSVKVICESCHGARLNPLALSVKYQNKNLGEVLELSIEEALQFFKAIPKIAKKIELLISLGLGYLKLGQDLNSLSGGETQRLKLANQLIKAPRMGKNLYLLDEPTLGLHFEDLKKLFNLLHKIADQGHTLIIVEHNLDMIAQADYIVDLGPGAADKGGKILVEGYFDKVLSNKESETIRYLNSFLKK